MPTRELAKVINESSLSFSESQLISIPSETIGRESPSVEMICEHRPECTEKVSYAKMTGKDKPRRVEV